MSDYGRDLPDDLRDIAERLSAARRTPSSLELDALRRRVRGRVERPGRRSPRRGLAAALRMNFVAAALTVGLVLFGGVGVVLACESLGVHNSPGPSKETNESVNKGGGNDGGNQNNGGGNKNYPVNNNPGNNNGGGNNNNGGGYNGDPFGGGGGGVFQTTSFHGHDSASFCQYHGPQTFSYRFRTPHGYVTVILVWDCFHLHFHFEFDPDRGFRFGGFSYRWNDGPSYNCNQSSYETTGPDGASELSFTTDGTSFNLPLTW